MAETTSDQEQHKKPQQASDAARPQPVIEAPQPELDGTAALLSRGPGLGSPDGIEQRASDSRQRKNANRQQRVQTMTAIQRQLGNQHVQRLLVQRRLADGLAPVQRAPKGADKDDAGSITVDEVGVTNAVYNKASVQTKEEVITPNPPPKDVKPEEDFIDVSAKAVCTYKATVSINLPSVPGGLSACQAKRVKDAIDNKLAPHEKQHEAAMKTYDGTYEEAFKLTHILRAQVNAELTAKAKQIGDAQQAIREAAAKQASDALDQPPFVVDVDLNCEDEKKPGKTDVEDTGAQPELAGGGEQAAAESGGMAE
jgi:hypothetical protein